MVPLGPSPGVTVQRFSAPTPVAILTPSGLHPDFGLHRHSRWARNRMCCHPVSVLLNIQGVRPRSTVCDMLGGDVCVFGSLHLMGQQPPKRP